MKMNFPDKQVFCSAPKPPREGDPPDVFCRRAPNHEGYHAAFTHSIKTPTLWAVEEASPATGLETER